MNIYATELPSNYLFIYLLFFFFFALEFENFVNEEYREVGS